MINKEWENSNVFWATMLDDALPAKLPKQRAIHLKLDLPPSVPSHKFTQEEVFILLEWLMNSKLKYRHDLAHYVLKIHFIGGMEKYAINFDN